MEIAPGIHQLKVPIPDNPLGHLNCYLVKGTAGWLMVDTGWYTPDAYEGLKQGLKDMGLTLNDIATMVVTHIHADHFGLAGRIKASSPKTKLVMQRWEADLIETRYIKFAQLRDKMSALFLRHGVPEIQLEPMKSASMPMLQYVITTFPDQTVHGGEILSTGVYDLEVIWTPGHSPGHICLYEPQNRLLFSGDHVLPKVSPNISYTAESGDNPLGDYIGALRKVQKLPVTKVLPAHEHIFTDLYGRVEDIIAHHDKRKREILAVVAKEPRNAYYVSSRINWDVPKLKFDQFPDHMKRSAVTETVAHLEALRWEGRLTRFTDNGVVTYMATT
ncbi:MAG: MBL fold metallo-hydrolase [Dehalococcoidia bacterium]|nr:MBL fold metallo-hydrolase [Dehalococcoidia bacterium]